MSLLMMPYSEGTVREIVSALHSCILRIGSFAVSPKLALHTCNTHIPTSFGRGPLVVCLLATVPYTWLLPYLTGTAR
jgi:hypothetical protein